MSEALKPINVVPHFMRLHEWVALAENLYEAEGLAPQTLQEHMHDISSHPAKAYRERPQDEPYLEDKGVCSTACHWAVPMNAGAGMGKFVPDVYGLTRFGMFVSPQSSITRLAELGNQPVGVGLMAGSHFSAIETLEKVLPTERIDIRDIGGPGRRLHALLDGEIVVANLLDPEIAMAEQRGLRKIAAGEFKTLFWVSPTIPQDVLDAYFRVMRKADAMLRAAPQSYMRLWENNIPPQMLAEFTYDYSTFGLGELLVFEAYTQAEYDQTLALAKRWKLDGNLLEGATRIDNIARTISV